MSRKKTQPKKVVTPDPIFNSTVIPKLINSIMYDGKKVVAEKIVYEAIEKIKSNIVLKCSIEEICKNSILIQESIIEDLDIKKKVFKQLDKLSNKDTIIASSSSYLLISKISEDVG